MSLNGQIIDFRSTADFEFGKKKTRKCRYKIYSPGAKKGLVVYIPGFGGDLGTYTEKFCQKIALQYSLSTMSVEYFGIHSRPNVGAQVYCEQSDIKNINKKLEDMGGIPKNSIQSDIQQLSDLAQQEGKVVTICGSLKPKHGEYQNFGLLPALDIINAIRDVISKFDIDPHNIYVIGSSYGGYLANLVTKFCPGLVKAVFDNSSWANPNLAYVVGREIDVPEFTMVAAPNVMMNLYVSSPWTLKSGLPNSFENEKFQIRAFDENHIRQMANQGGKNTAYIFFHAINDGIANTQEKVDMVRSMIKHGIENIQMEVMEESDVDGKFIKTLDHGLGLSMLEFFALSFQYVRENFEGGFTCATAEMVSYVSQTSKYTFDYSKTPLAAELIEI